MSDVWVNPTRREILQRGIAGGVSLSAIGLLAACGSDDESASGDQKSGTGQLEDEVRIIAWAQEWEFAKAGFEKETGVKVKMTFQDDPLDSAQKVRASAGQFDIVSFGPLDTPFISAGLMQELDPDRLERWQDLPVPLREKLASELDDKVYMVPYYWGGTIMARQTEVVKGPVDSWAALWDPANKGKVGLLDQAAEAYARMALYAGFDISDYSEESLDRAREAALELIPNVKTYWSTGTDILQHLSRGEVGLTDVFDGTARDLIKKQKPVEIVFPREGVRGWIDGPGIVKDAPHPNAAYAWINYVSRPEIGAQLAEEFSFTPANAKAFDRLDQSTRDLLRADETEKLFASGGLKLQRLSVEDNQKLADWWERTKIAGG